MREDVLLEEYSAAPQYNIKAVVKATNISSSTLRAWERRYQMCAPQRSGSNYRLYSERDIAAIRWLKHQVDAGMAISRAVAWLDRLVDEAGGRDQAILPGSADSSLADVAPLLAEPPERNEVRNTVRSVDSLKNELLQALTAFQERVAEDVLAEAFSLYTAESVIEQLIVPTMVEIGQRWHDDVLSTTAEHFATNYLLQRIIALLRVGTSTMTGPAIWIGCAPGEFHEIGALLLTVFLRRAGHHVHFLGRGLAIDDLVSEVAHQRPAGLILSASSVEAAESLRTVSIRIAELGSPQAFVGYGGRIFSAQPELKDSIAGTYLGSTAQDAVSGLDALLQASPIER